MPPAKAIKTERTHAENQERAYIAASRRSDRPLSGRVESARKASEVHKMRTGRSLRITEEDVANEEMYEEEDDHLPDHLRRFNINNSSHFKTTDVAFNRRLQHHLALSIGMRQAFANSYSPADPNMQAQSFFTGGNMPNVFPSSMGGSQQQQEKIMRQQQELQMMQLNTSPMSPSTHALAYSPTSFTSPISMQFQQQQPSTFASAATDQNKQTSAFEKVESTLQPQHLQPQQNVGHKRASISISTSQDDSTINSPNKRRFTIPTPSEFPNFDQLLSPSAISSNSPATSTSGGTSPKEIVNSPVQTDRPNVKRKPSFAPGAFDKLRLSHQDSPSSQRPAQQVTPQNKIEPQPIGQSQKQAPNVLFPGYNQDTIAGYNQTMQSPYNVAHSSFSTALPAEMQMFFGSAYDHQDPMASMLMAGADPSQIYNFNPVSQSNKLQSYATLEGLNSTLALSANGVNGAEKIVREQQVEITDPKYFEDLVLSTPGVNGMYEFIDWDNLPSSQS